jgi:hypothetical protein
MPATGHNKCGVLYEKGRMMRTSHEVVSIATVALATAGMFGASTGAAVGAPHAAAAVHATPHLGVTEGAKSFTVSGPTTFDAGRVNVTLTSTDKSQNDEPSFNIVSIKKGYTFAKFKKATNAFFGAEDTQSGPTPAQLKGLKTAVAHSVLYGGLDHTGKGSFSGSVVLPKAGTYYLFGGPNLITGVQKLTVTGPAVQRAATGSKGTVVAETGNKYGGSTTLPHDGVITFKNTSTGKLGDTKSPHLLDLIHVKEGTTKKDIENYFASGSQNPPPFALQGEADLDVVSPGQAMTAKISLPKGEYAALCFFPMLAGPEAGTPHAAMGMIRIVHLV